MLSHVSAHAMNHSVYRTVQVIANPTLCISLKKKIACAEDRKSKLKYFYLNCFPDYFTTSWLFFFPFPNWKDKNRWIKKKMIFLFNTSKFITANVNLNRMTQNTSPILFLLFQYLYIYLILLFYCWCFLLFFVICYKIQIQNFMKKKEEKKTIKRKCLA